jgi:hypothetical protein
VEQTERQATALAVALAVVGIGVEILVVVTHYTHAKPAAWVLWLAGVLGTLLIVAGIVLAVLAAKHWLPPRLIPFAWVGFRGRTRKDVERAFEGFLRLRWDVQQAAHRLDAMPSPTPVDLRTFADNLATRLRDAGYDVSAKKVEVDLPDNATEADTKARRDTLHTAIYRMLLWDEFT